MHPNTTFGGVRNKPRQTADARTRAGEPAVGADPQHGIASPEYFPFGPGREPVKNERAGRRRRCRQGGDRHNDSRGLSPPRRCQDRQIYEGPDCHLSCSCCANGYHIPGGHASSAAHGAAPRSEGELTSGSIDEFLRGAWAPQRENGRHENQRAQRAQWDSTEDGREQRRPYGERCAAGVADQTTDRPRFYENDWAHEELEDGLSGSAYHRRVIVEMSDYGSGSSNSGEVGRGYSSPPYSPPSAPPGSPPLGSPPPGSPPYSPPGSPPYSPPGASEYELLQSGGGRGAPDNSSEAAPNAPNTPEYIPDGIEKLELPMGPLNNINEPRFSYDLDAVWEEIDNGWEQNIMTRAKRQKEPATRYYSDECYRMMAGAGGEREVYAQNTNTEVARPCLKRGRDHSLADDRPAKRPRERSTTPPWGRSPPRNTSPRRSPGAQLAPRRRGGIKVNQVEERIKNYVPEAIGIVRDPLDRVFRSPVPAEILSDMQLTYLALNHCPARNSLLTAGAELSRGLEPSSAGGMEDIFALGVVVYHNGQQCLNFYSSHLLAKRHSCTYHRNVVSKCVSVLETSELRRESRAHVHGTPLPSRELWNMDDFLRNPPAEGTAGSEYADNQTVLQFLASRFERMDHFEFILHSAETAGSIIFALRSVYRALTNSDCILTARLYRNGREVSQCGMSALEDRQRKEVEDQGNRPGNLPPPVRRNPYSYGHICSIGTEL